MDILKNKDRRNGLIGTIVINAGALCAFVFMSLTRPSENQNYIEMSLGGAASNLAGEDAALIPAIGQREDNSPTISQASSAVQSKQAIITQDEAETIAIEKKLREEEQIRADENRKKKEESDKLFSTAFNNNAQGINKGGEPGDSKGVPQGPTGQTSAEPTVELGSRNLIKSPEISETSQEYGKVAVKIVVDRAGNVIRAIAGQKGSTTSSTYLFKIAEEAALKTKFDARPDAQEEQVGTLTFTFRLE